MPRFESGLQELIDVAALEVVGIDEALPFLIYPEFAALCLGEALGKVDRIAANYFADGSFLGGGLFP